ncbi:uncharacterized protein LOC114805370 [Zeugodacus cucurbitae]|uniref:uncharacterized protein LOC114805370 n=1 Tax=Zeugodacus cucurbitae TaxID=28588 RepID=UPI0010A7459F|nr:uncharacterized protein LOC114805370 [Zeugodacus cucurbitae]
MKVLYTLLLLMLITCLTNLKAVEANRLVLKPMSAREVYQLLANSGRSSSIPQGRIVTQGLAFIGDITRRITGANKGTRVTTQEVCYETRSARSLAEAEAVFDAYVAASNRRDTDSLQKRVRNSEVGRILKLKKRKKLRVDEERRGNQRIRNDDAEPVSLPGLGSRTATPTYSTDSYIYTSPHRSSLTSDPAVTTMMSNSDVTVTTNPTTTMNRKNDATITTFTTSTTPEGAINCIVIKKNE